METIRPIKTVATTSARFVATAGQTTFTPPFMLSATSIVLVNGAEQSWGWSRVAGSVVFDAGQNQGTEILIIN